MKNSLRFNELDNFFLQAHDDGIEVVDNRGKVLYANPAFFRITGMSPSDRLGRSIFEVNPEGGLATALRTGRSITGAKIRSPIMDREVIGNITAVYSKGKLAGAILVARDISDIISLSKKLVEKKTEISNGLYYRFGRARFSFDDILSESSSIFESIRLARRAADSDAPVLIQGETGVGKELFAHAIHSSSPRTSGPLISLNCAAIPQTLIESELFGHVQGAFTGATKTRIGAFELASGGTLFLDEIGEFPVELQAKLLRVLESNEVRQVGANRAVRINTRIISSTNRNLQLMKEEGLFRSDLYFRLDVISIFVPPLRERKADIPILARYFIQRFCDQLGVARKEIHPHAFDLLTSHNWPGNIRELENVLQYAVLVSPGPIINMEHILPKVPNGKKMPRRIKHLKSLRVIEQEMILLALEKYGVSFQGKKKAAAELGISLSSLYNKIKKLK